MILRRCALDTENTQKLFSDSPSIPLQNEIDKYQLRLNDETMFQAVETYFERFVHGENVFQFKNEGSLFSLFDYWKSQNSMDTLKPITAVCLLLTRWKSLDASYLNFVMWASIFQTYDIYESVECAEPYILILLLSKQGKT